MILNIRALAVLAALSFAATACVAPTGDETEAEETNQDLVSRSASFETFEGLDGQYYFHLMAGNGENVLRSEGYTTLASAKKGMASVLANGNDKRNFDVREAKSGEFYFTLKAGNGEVIGQSQLYESKYNAERGARTVRALVRLEHSPKAHAAPEQQRFEIFKGEDRQTYFRLRAGNGEIMLGSEGYVSKSGAQKGIASVLENGVDEASFQVYEAFDGAWGVRLVAKNHEVIARGETYASKSNANRAVEDIVEILDSGDLRITAN